MLPPLFAPLAAGVAAAVLSWCANALFAKLCPPVRAALAAAVEEPAKTLTAVFCGADIFLVHLAFGLVEGVWEAFFRTGGGPYAGVLATITHAAFGLATAHTWDRTGSLLSALATGTLFHTAWNLTVLAFAKSRSQKAD